VVIGTTVTDTLVVLNEGTDDLLVTGMRFDDAHYDAAPQSFTLEAGGSREVFVTFTPTEPGPAPGALRISSNDPDEPLVTVALTGNRLSPPAIDVTPTALNADVRPGETETQQIKIDNTAGAGELTWQIFSASSSSAAQTQTAASSSPDATETFDYASRYKSYAGATPDPEYRTETLPKTDPASLVIAQAMQSTLADGIVVFFDDMESGVNGWTHYLVHPSGFDQWAQSTARSSSGVTSWRVTQHAGSGSDALESPAIDLTDYRDATLVIQHWYNFDDCSDPSFEPDGGIVEISTDDGTTWTQVFPVGGYPYTLADYCGNPLAFRQAYSHDGGNGSAFVPAVFEISAFAGEIISIRFHAGWDCGNCQQNEGWYIDDVTVFAEGVEWLSASPTSGVVPAGSDQVVDITFDATGLYGAYEANLIVQSNDPVNPEVTVPVVLNVDSTNSVTGAEESGVPSRFALHSNYPNPFNPITTITYDLPVTVDVRLEIYDVKGKRIATLVDREEGALDHALVSSLEPGDPEFHLQKRRTDGARRCGLRDRGRCGLRGRNRCVALLLFLCGGLEDLGL